VRVTPESLSGLGRLARNAVTEKQITPTGVGTEAFESAGLTSSKYVRRHEEKVLIFLSMMLRTPMRNRGADVL